MLRSGVARHGFRQIGRRQKIGATSDYRLGEARIAHDPASQRRATLGVIAASTATGWRCHRADSVRAFDQRAAAPLSPADRPHHRVNFGSFERACRKVHVADRSLVQMARKSDDWPVRASSSPPPVHRWPIRTAAFVHVWPVAGRAHSALKAVRRHAPVLRQMRH